MSAHAMALALGRRAVYLSHFTPSMMAPETLASAHSKGMVEGIVNSRADAKKNSARTL